MASLLCDGKSLLDVMSGFLALLFNEEIVRCIFQWLLRFLSEAGCFPSCFHSVYPALFSREGTV